MKLNLGSGSVRYEGFLNVDDDANVNPDFLIDLEKGVLPFESDSIEEIKAHHILEHIGDGFIPLIQEIYRVLKDKAILDIVVPHHRHEVFYGDPTHKRPITVNGMMLFSKKFCKAVMENKHSNSTLAFKYNVDFDLISNEDKYDDFYIPLLNLVNQRIIKNEISQEDLFTYQRLMREANNVVIETHIKMMAIKS